MPQLPLPVVSPSPLPWGRPEAQQLLDLPLQEASDQLVSLGHYFWLLKRRWLWIVSAVVVCTGLAALAAFRLTPIYESTVRIAIDPQTPSTVVGDPGVLGATSDNDQMFNTEIQIIQSDGVLRPVAEAFHLLGAANTSTFHLSNLWKSQQAPAGVNPTDAPVSLAGLSVTHPANSFLIDISYRSADPSQAAAIANEIATSYIQRGMETRAHSAMENSAFMEKQIAQLKQNMDDSAMALIGFEKRLGVIDPKEKTSLLEGRLLQLNTQLTDAQNDRIRTQVDSQALQTDSLAAVEVSPQGAALSKMEDALHVAQAKMATVKTIYGPNNLEYKVAADQLSEASRQFEAARSQIGNRIDLQHREASNRENMLRAALLQAKGESDALHAQSLQYDEVKREAETNKSLYDELFRKVKEASINGEFKGGAIRIADLARPQLRAEFPNKTIFLALGFLFSLSASSIAVLIADMMDKSLRTPEQAQRAFGVEVVGMLPRVRNFPSLFPAGLLGSSTGETANRGLTQRSTSSEFYEEAIYTLLSSILAPQDAPPMRTILVTSATAGEGKSSCIAHMAAAHARQGYRTLLIDADLRRPAQQKNFNLGSEPCLAKGILLGHGLEDMRQRVKGYDNLDVIVAGTSGRRVLDWVGRKVEVIIAQARNEYDFVFIDAPPMLCFAEPMQLAQVADGVLVVSHSGRSSRQSVGSVLGTLRRLGVTPLGIVLNQVAQDLSPQYQSYQLYYRRLGRTA